MNNSDISELIHILKESKRLECWGSVDDAIDFLNEFVEDEKSRNEED